MPPFGKRFSSRRDFDDAFNFYAGYGSLLAQFSGNSNVKKIGQNRQTTTRPQDAWQSQLPQTNDNLQIQFRITVCEQECNDMRHKKLVLVAQQRLETQPSPR